jgi:predicted transcriptional regulator
MTSDFEKRGLREALEILNISNLEEEEVDVEIEKGRFDTSLAIRETKRSKLERYLDILKVVSEFGPIRRTHVLYRANLSWNELRDSLEALEHAEAITQVLNGKGTFYKITKTGQSILSHYAGIQSSLNKVSAPKDTAPESIWDRLGKT